MGGRRPCAARRYRSPRGSASAAASDPSATIIDVPRISEFYGIVIEMYFAGHPPPHFHARYSGEEALIVIETGEVFAGWLPGRALRLVREWLAQRRPELVANWERASAHQATEPVAPLR
jgi:hypothetical protein